MPLIESCTSIFLSEGLFSLGIQKQLYSHMLPFQAFSLSRILFLHFSMRQHQFTVNKDVVRSLVWIFLDKLLNACHVADNVELEAFRV